MSIHGRILKEILRDSDSSGRPAFADLYAIGSLIGLDKSDIIRLHRQDKSSGLRAVLVRHWRILLPMMIVIVIVVMLIAYVLAGNPPASPSSVYPSGARYGVVKKRDFITKHTHS